MAIIKKDKLREMPDSQLQTRLFEFERELNMERGMLATGGRTSNPGKITGLKKAVAQILTIMHERKLGIKKKLKAAAAPKDKKPAVPAKSEVKAVG